MTTNGFPVATTPAPGIAGVDWEVRVDFERLRTYRLDRPGRQLEASDLGALLLFETSNIRYVTATQIGYWAFNKGERYALLTRTGPTADLGLRFGREGAPAAAAAALRRRRTRSAATPGSRARSARVSACRRAPCRGDPSIMMEEGVGDMPLGVDVAETSIFLELQNEGIDGPRRATGDDGRARDQEPGRDHAADTGLRDGRRRVPGHLRGPEARRPRERHRRPRARSGCSRWARSSSRRSTRSPANDAARTRTSSAIG